MGAPEFDHLERDQKPEERLLRLRAELNGFANLRPAACFPALADCSPLRRSRVEGADVLIVRELLGGLYFSERGGFGEDCSSAFNTMRYSLEEIERVADVSCQLARSCRKMVTLVFKAYAQLTSRL